MVAGVLPSGETGGDDIEEGEEGPVGVAGRGEEDVNKDCVDGRGKDAAHNQERMKGGERGRAEWWRNLETLNLKERVSGKWPKSSCKP